METMGTAAVQRKINRSEIEGTIREIKTYNGFTSGTPCILVNIEHIVIGLRGESKSWFWLQVIGDSVSRFHRDFKVGSYIYAVGRLHTHKFTGVFDKPVRLTLIIVQRMSKEPIE